MPAKRPDNPARELLFGNLWEFDPAPETADPQIAPRYQLFINGKFTAPKSKTFFDSISPGNEQKISEIALANKADVDAAFTAATAALPRWSATSGADRGKYLYRIARLLQDRSREFAVAETIDGGSPIRQSRDFDLPLAAAHFFYHAGWADKLNYVTPGRTLGPLGVVGQILPWGSPLLMLAWKIAPALATGNTVVLKPAETTSVTAMKFATILEDAGLPPGVVNILTGAGDTGMNIVRHPSAAKIAFTGSSETGRLVQRALVGTDKSLTLSLGSKATHIVFEDAPLDQAVEGIVNSLSFHQGPVCPTGSLLFVQESIAAEILGKLKLRLRHLHVGNPLDKNTDIGAINSRKQLEKIQALVNASVKEGAEMFQSHGKLPSKGFYFAPTLFSNVSLSHRIAREEIPGPILSILTFRTPEEAAEKANNTPHGLTTSLWTDKGSRILKMSAELKAGVVWANTCDKFDPASPFGGCKESGFGREGGKQGLLDYAQLL
jgi:aldehyde dehydrogenase (NAD+)